MGLFGFGKKEKDKMKDGLEKTRTGFWGNILNTLTGRRSTMTSTTAWKNSLSWPTWAAKWPSNWWTSCVTG